VYPAGASLFSRPASVPSRVVDPRITERRNPRTQQIDLADPLGITDLMNAEDQDVPRAVA
jgi:N-acetylmuramic acid 6-phosphate etherase